MAKLLYVKAHPLTEQFSRSITVGNAFIEAYKASHPDDEVIELSLYDEYIPDIDKDLLMAWGALQKGAPFEQLSAEQQKKLAAYNSHTDQFLASDKLVIANPLWNLSFPPRLKIWIDAVSVADKSFTYTEEGKAVGLLKGKKALHIQANGGYYNGNDPGSQYIKGLFTFLGIEQFQQLFVEGMDHNPEQAQQIVAAAIEKARQLAVDF